jgi:hypothetical protein
LQQAALQWKPTLRRAFADTTADMRKRLENLDFVYYYEYEPGSVQPKLDEERNPIMCLRILGIACEAERA